MSRWILIWRAYPAIRFPCVSASFHVARVFHARSRIHTCHTSPFLRIMGLVIAECPQLPEMQAGERSSVTGQHDGGLRVSERADSFARVLVPCNVVHDVGDAVLHEFPFNGFTGLASGLGEQFGDGLVGVHGGCFLGTGKARHLANSDGPFGGGSGGECSGLSVDTVLDEGQVVGFHFDADRVEAFDECGFDGCS